MTVVAATQAGGMEVLAPLPVGTLLEGGGRVGDALAAPAAPTAAASAPAAATVVTVNSRGGCTQRPADADRRGGHTGAAAGGQRRGGRWGER